MWFASVEGNNNERLNVLDGRGLVGGKPLLAFLLGLFGYCSDQNNEPPIQWFVRLELLADEPLSPLAKPLEQAVWSSDLDIFRDNEYGFFRHRYPDWPMTEAQFEEAVREFRDKFVDIGVLRTSVRKLIEILKATQIEADEAWYDPIDTIGDLDGLHQALELLAQRGAEKAIIRID